MNHNHVYNIIIFLSLNRTCEARPIKTEKNDNVINYELRPT